MGTHTKRGTTDTHTTAKVKGKGSDEAVENTQEADEAGGSGEGAPGHAKGTQTIDPEFAGMKGEQGGALAREAKDVQTEAQFNAAGPDQRDRNEVHEFIETGAGRVQSTTPNNDPAR